MRHTEPCRLCGYHHGGAHEGERYCPHCLSVLNITKRERPRKGPYKPQNPLVAVRGLAELARVRRQERTARDCR